MKIAQERVVRSQSIRRPLKAVDQQGAAIDQAQARGGSDRLQFPAKLHCPYLLDRHVERAHFAFQLPLAVRQGGGQSGGHVAIGKRNRRLGTRGEPCPCGPDLLEFFPGVGYSADFRPRIRTGGGGRGDGMGNART